MEVIKKIVVLMFKKITLLALVALSATCTFVSCSSSDDETEQNQNSYNINPPSWLHGQWKNSDGDQFTFTVDDIQFSDIDGGSWKFLFNSWKETINNNKSRFYDKNKTDNYYEAEYFYYEGFLDTNIKVNKAGTNTITVKYTYYQDDGSIINIENYSLIKSN